jgi:hypothetical protein
MIKGCARKVSRYQRSTSLLFERFGSAHAVSLDMYTARRTASWEDTYGISIEHSVSTRLQDVWVLPIIFTRRILSVTCQFGCATGGVVLGADLDLHLVVLTHTIEHT